MANPKGQAARAAVRRSEALELRCAGGSYRQIGKALGVSEKTAYYDVDHALASLDAVQKQRAERLRDLELARLDRMTAALGAKMRHGDEKAIRVMVQIMERRSKLLGLDAPTKVDATTSGEPLVFTLNLTRPRDL